MVCGDPSGSRSASTSFMSGFLFAALVLLFSFPALVFDFFLPFFRFSAASALFALSLILVLLLVMLIMMAFGLCQFLGSALH